MSVEVERIGHLLKSGLVLKIYCNSACSNFSDNEPVNSMMLQRAQLLFPKLTPSLSSRQFHISPIRERVQAARYKITPKRDKPLTYEMANPPHFIAHRKAWNSWNVCE